MTDIRVDLVSSKKDLRAFIAVPNDIYRDDPSWIAPLWMERLEALQASSNPFFREAEAAFFVARRNGKPVGRISAQIEPAAQALHGKTLGHFGFFDAIDDRQVAATLFAAAEGWLKERGCDRVRGPLNPSINSDIGILVDGFDTPPFIEMAYSAPYTAALVESQGYEKAIDAFAYLLDISRQFKPSFRRIADRARKDADVRIRDLDMKNFEAEIRTIVDIYNDAWADNWGAVPISSAAALAMAKSLRPVASAHRIKICELQGEPVAAMVVIPDVNDAIRDFGGKLLPFNWIKLVYRLFVKYPRRVRVVLMGVKKETRDTMLGGALAVLMICDIRDETVKRGATAAELSWVLETNDNMNGIARRLGADAYKTYRIYEKTL